MTAETDWGASYRNTDELDDPIVAYIDDAHRMTHEVVTGVCQDCKDGWPLRCDRCMGCVTTRSTGKHRAVQACDCTRRAFHYKYPTWWRPAS